MINELELWVVASTLPKSPPLTLTGDIQFLDLVEGYTEEEKEYLWEIYEAGGGMMEKRHGVDFE